jgi:EAL domain-containing protein (putative c-di-GMP-specific phosphodiesterase class I)
VVLDAHEAGVGVTLELHVLAAALDVLPDLPPEVYLSLNVSPAVILDAGFQNLMRRPNLPLRRIVVEITEHTAVSHYDDIRDVLRPHREHGLRLAVDDAGAGYASFSHVLKLRPDIIKLDRSLVTGIDLDGARRAFVTAIVVLAMELQADVTAEGVETTSELDVLRCLGVDTVQGYLLARPTPDRARLDGWGTRDWLTHAGLARSASRSSS